MKTLDNPSNLELYLLKEAYRRYFGFGFPLINSISVNYRVKSEAGRQTLIVHGGSVNIADGLIPLAQVELPVLGLLLLAELEIESGKVTCLHIIASGNDVWDGDEPEPYDLFVN